MLEEAHGYRTTGASGSYRCRGDHRCILAQGSTGQGGRDARGDSIPAGRDGCAAPAPTKPAHSAGPKWDSYGPTGSGASVTARRVVSGSHGLVARGIARLGLRSRVYVGDMYDSPPGEFDIYALAPDTPCAVGQISLASRIVCPSVWSGRILLSRGFSDITVIPHGLEDIPKQEKGIASTLRVFFPDWRNPRKDARTFLDALKRSRRPITWLGIGPPPSPSDIPNNVTYVPIYPEEVGRADVHVNTALAEAFCLAAFYTAACGVPQILADNSCHREFWAPSEGVTFLRQVAQVSGGSQSSATQLAQELADFNVGTTSDDLEAIARSCSWRHVGDKWRAIC